MTTIVAYKGVLAADSRISFTNTDNAVGIDSRQVKLVRIKNIYTNKQGKRVYLRWIAGSGSTQESNSTVSAMQSLTYPVEITAFLERYKHSSTPRQSQFLGILENGDPIQIIKHHTTEFGHHWKAQTSSNQNAVIAMGSGTTVIRALENLKDESFTAADYVRLACLFDSSSGGIITSVTAEDVTPVIAGEWTVETKEKLRELFNTLIDNGVPLHRQRIPEKAFTDTKFEIIPVEASTKGVCVLVPAATVKYLADVPITNFNQWVELTSDTYRVGTLKLTKLSHWLYQLVGVVEDGENNPRGGDVHGDSIPV